MMPHQITMIYPEPPRSEFEPWAIECRNQLGCDMEDEEAGCILKVEEPRQSRSGHLIGCLVSVIIVTTACTLSGIFGWTLRGWLNGTAKAAAVVTMVAPAPTIGWWNPSYGEWHDEMWLDEHHVYSTRDLMGRAI